MLFFALILVIPLSLTRPPRWVLAALVIGRNSSILQLKLEKCYRRVILRHIMSILVSVFTIGYKGKMVQMENIGQPSPIS